jgi:hypothetical protein
MTAADVLPQLSSVKHRGARGWLAQCPAHDDRSPSLSISDGHHTLLLKCFAGCTVGEITKALGIRVVDLFYDAGLTDSPKRREARRHRALERAARQSAYEAEGRQLDILRESENLIQSARGISIEGWSDSQLNAALDRLGTAYQLLESETA